MAYETDFYRWTTEQAGAVREARFADLDLAALVEEVEARGRREADALVNANERILIHVLRWQAQPGQRCDNWRRLVSPGRRVWESHTSWKCAPGCPRRFSMGGVTTWCGVDSVLRGRGARRLR